MTKTEDLLFLEPDEAARWREELGVEARGVVERFTRRVAAGRDLDEMMDFLYEATRDLAPCDRISLAFLEDAPEGTLAKTHWTRTEYDEPLLRNGYAQYLWDSSLAEVIRRGAPRILNDLEAYSQRHPASRSTRLILREGVRSSLTVPLLVEGRRVGFLFRSARRPEAFTRRDAMLHAGLAEPLGQAVEKAREIERLAEANQAYTEMLAFVTHELKSPLASLSMDAETLSGGFLGELTEPQRSKLDAIQRKAAYLQGLVKDYLDLARVEAGSVDPEMRTDVDFVAEVLEPCLEMTVALAQEHGAVIEQRLPDIPVHVEADPALLKIVVSNLLGNAVKYGNQGGRVRVTVEARDNRLHVSVWNEGPGFAPAEQSRLFRRFSRLRDPALRNRKGTGVGLYTSWRIVQQHHGRIRAESEHGEWAEFLFDIPLRQTAGDREPHSSPGD